MAFAATEGRALVMIDRKQFIRLHRDSSSHAGIIVCTYDPDFVGQAARVSAAIVAQPDLAGQLLRVNRPA